MVESLLFVYEGAGARAGEKKKQSRWKTDQLRKTELPVIVNRLIKKHFIKGTVQQDF